MKEEIISNNKSRRAYNIEINERSALRVKFESIDDVLPYVGNFGRYQWYLLFALLPYGVMYAILYFSTFFLTLVPQEYWCYVPDLQEVNLTMEEKVAAVTVSSTKYPYYERCYRKDLNFHELLRQQHNENFDSELWQGNATVKCDKWEYNLTQVPYLTISSELDWVCDNEYLISSTQAIFFCGSITGSFIFGWIADHKGRIPALVLCSAVAFFGTIATAWATSFWSFALCRFVTGLAFDNCINIPLIIVVEYMAVNRRTIVFNIAFGIYFAFGSTILPWLAYYIADWRFFSYVVAAPLFIGFFTPWILPESARWYAATDQWDKVIDNLKHVAKINKKNPDPRIYDALMRNADTRGESATLLALFKTPRLARTTILLTTFWSLIIVLFDGNVYSLKLLRSSVFVSFSLASATELPAGLLVTLILDRWGRRLCGFLTVGAIGIFSFTELYVPSTEGKLASSVLSRFAGNMAANIGLQYAAELLPTPVRAQGIALVHLFGILAHALAPYVIDLAYFWEGLPMILIGTLALINATLVLFLPETAGQKLPQTLQQGEDFGKDVSFWSLPGNKKSSHISQHITIDSCTIE